MREIHRVITSMDAPNDLNASDGFSDFKSDRIPIKRKKQTCNCNFYRVIEVSIVCLKCIVFLSMCFVSVCIQFYLEFGTSFPLSWYFFDQTYIRSFFFEIKIISLIIHKTIWWLSVYFLQMVQFKIRQWRDRYIS